MQFQFLAPGHGRIAVMTGLAVRRVRCQVLTKT